MWSNTIANRNTGTTRRQASRTAAVCTQKLRSSKRAAKVTKTGRNLTGGGPGGSDRERSRSRSQSFASIRRRNRGRHRDDQQKTTPKYFWQQHSRKILGAAALAGASLIAYHNWNSNSSPPTSTLTTPPTLNKILTHCVTVTKLTNLMKQYVQMNPSVRVETSPIGHTTFVILHPEHSLTVDAIINEINYNEDYLSEVVNYGLISPEDSEILRLLQEAQQQRRELHEYAPNNDIFHTWCQ